MDDRGSQMEDPQPTGTAYRLQCSACGWYTESNRLLKKCRSCLLMTLEPLPAWTLRSRDVE